jgi:GT2 family glycosyltransferase
MICIIIPVFNRKDFTRNCLISLSKQTFREYEIIVVDDGSTDGTSDMIEREFPQVKVLKGDGNLWWAGATNIGIEYVLKSRSSNEEDYILTLNNDLEVSGNYLELMFSNASKIKKSILGSVSVDINDNNRMDFCGIEWNEFTGKYYVKAKEYNYLYSNLKNKRALIDSDLLPGRGTLIPIKAIQEIGLFDSLNFPQYAADEDFSLRARRKGWKLIIPTNTYLKSHITETGTDIANIEFKWRYFKHLFFSIKSPINLKTRYRWAIKNTKLKWAYFFIDTSKIMMSVFFKVLKKVIS